LSSAPELAYQLDAAALGPYAERFVPLVPDAETHAWLEGLGAQPHGWFLTQLVDVVARFTSLYDAHGLTGSYPMHLLSQAQWRELVGGDTRALLDVGAGAGYVAAGARPWFKRILCTETSQRLAARLEARGFEVHPHDVLDVPLSEGPGAFDVISCLNVLDRTARPASLLRALRELMTAQARLLVALPLPARPHVHVAGATVTPVERLPLEDSSFEAACLEMSQWLEQQGFHIERIARLPYLSRGDAKARLYVLDDALWLLRRAG
jgi:SAM-dependent methyltransferase